MFNLPENNIHLSAKADTKEEAIKLVAAALEQTGYVEAGYLQGMLAREQQTSTFLGNGIAIPHGTLDTRTMVKNTGIQVFQFPQGIEWGEGNTAYVVIGIAARSDEHLALLRQLTHVLGDEDTASTLATLQDTAKFRAILMGEHTEFDIPADNITLDVNTHSLLTLVAMNAGKLEQQRAVNSQFVSDVISQPALPLAEGIWITDSVLGNLKNALAISRALKPFQVNNKTVQTVLTIAAENEQINAVLARLLDKNTQQILTQGNTEQIIAALKGQPQPTQNTVQSARSNTSISAPATNSVIGTFTVRNEHGLHARPSTVLVNTVKPFAAKITVENLDRATPPVSAKSMMKIVALGATVGHRLRFVAEGEDAQQAIEAIQKAMIDGLGEAVSSVPPKVADSIEVVGAANSENNESAVKTEQVSTQTSDELEATFVIHNDNGIHARPATVLVNTVKQYNATVMVQNLDRDSQPVSAKSMMKIISLGATKGTRLRFTATGEQAKEALAGIGAAIAEGLGE